MFAGCLFSIVATSQSDSSSFISYPDVEQSNCSEGIGFPGGQEALDTYIKEELNFSGIEADDIERVYCLLYIAENGEVQKVGVENTDNPEIIKIATGSLMHMPRWEPFMKNGKSSERVVRIAVKIDWQNNSIFN